MSKKLTEYDFATLLSEGVMAGLDDLGIYKEVFPETPDEKLRQEIAAYQVLGLLTSISSFYKDNQAGPRIFKLTLDKLERDLVSMGIFENIASADEFFELRLKKYNKIIQEHKNENYLVPLSVEFVKMFGGHKVSDTVFLTEIFVKCLNSDLEFIEKVDILLE